MNKQNKVESENKQFSEKERVTRNYDSGNGKRTVSQKLADKASKILGSWNYILFQTVFVISWVILNVVGFFYKWDEYPFIFLNLALSIMAAYTAPIILMSQNREADRDRKRAITDLATDRSSERKIKDVQQTLIRLEEKIDQINKIKS